MYPLWALGHHRRLQDRVFAEVSALGGRPLTPEDLPQLGYTVRVLHEALRLCPPAAGTPRIVNTDLAVDGYRLQAGTVAVVCIDVMHRDPGLWEDPLMFNPDRFLPERSQGRSRWQFLPFGGGPRSCIGDHFAMLEATLALATIIRTAVIESLDAGSPLERRSRWSPPHLSVRGSTSVPQPPRTSWNPWEAHENEVCDCMSSRLNGSAAENERAIRRWLSVFSKWTSPNHRPHRRAPPRPPGVASWLAAWEPVIQPHAVGDHLRRVTVSLVRRCSGHDRRSGQRPRNSPT